MKHINFYSTRDPYGEFSNFSIHRIFLKDKLWPTSEHYFQAQKFAGTEHEEAVRVAPTAKIAAEMGRDRKRPLRPDWESVKDDVMREAVRAKFTQHKELRELLLSTGDAELIEQCHGMRQQVDADAQQAQLADALVDPARDPALVQRERRRQTAHPGTDDQYINVVAASVTHGTRDCPRSP